MAEQRGFALHPEAAKAFNAAAARLAVALRSAAPSTQARTLTGSAAHLPVAAQIGRTDLQGALEQRLVAEDRVLFAEDERSYQLDAEGAVDFRRIVRSVAMNKDIADVCDEEFVQDSLIRWLQRAGDGAPAEDWIAALCSELAREARQHKFRVPLVGVHIEAPFALGPWTISYFTEQDIDAAARLVPDERYRALAREKYARHYQGKVCVEGQVTAVPSRAKSAAMEAAAAVVRGLQFVHPAAFDIGLNSSLGTYDCRRPHIEHVLFQRGSAFAASSRIATSEQQAVDLMIDRHTFGIMMQAGLGAVSAFLGAEKHSSLHEKAWVALEVFASGVASTAPRDRLIGALVAVETLLLGDTQGIQRALGQRMATLVASSFAERKALIRDLAVAYQLRSGFLHHGREVAQNRDALNRFVRSARDVIHHCLISTSFATERDLIEHLDDGLLGEKES
jgi:hypothetical protein